MRNKAEDRVVDAMIDIMSSWRSIRSAKMPPSDEMPDWQANLLGYLWTMLGIYSPRHALIPLGLMSVPGIRFTPSGTWRWSCREIYVFGVRVARWNVHGAKWFPFPKVEKERDPEELPLDSKTEAAEQ